MTLSNAILNRKCFLRKDRDILNAVWEIITECPITRAGEGLITNLPDMGVGVRGGVGWGEKKVALKKEEWERLRGLGGE